MSLAGSVLPHALPRSTTVGPHDWRWPLLSLTAVYLALSGLLRLLLFLRFGHGDGVGYGLLPAILGVGLVNDALQAISLTLPLSLFLVLSPRQDSRLARRLLAGGLWLTLLSLLFVAASEYFFFEEFDSRFNLVAVDYLIYPTEVIGDIRDEYPVVPLLTVFALLSALGTALLLRGFASLRTQPVPPWSRRLSWLGLHLALASLVLALWTAQTLTPFANRAANELGANGPARFFAAFRNNHIDYPVFYRTGEPAALRQRLGADLAPGGGQFVNLPGGD
ncbi:MAG TPA: hypothetical protein VFV11_02150, partial [Solimonas sp.]|nr:hypothetical protein [Solimonas sp.]